MDGSEVVNAEIVNGAPKVSIRGLSKIFGKGPDATIALQDIDLDIGEHSFVTLVGASGCGKSTLLRIVAGLEFHTTGEVVANDKPVTGPGADRAMVFQQYSLFPWLTVMENIRFSRKLAANRGNFTSAEVEAASGRADTPNACVHSSPDRANNSCATPAPDSASRKRRASQHCI